MNEQEIERYEQERKLEAKRAEKEFLLSENSVVKSIGYSYFVSTSKGKERKRKQPKEVELFSWRKNEWHIKKKFPADELACEAMGKTSNSDELITHIRRYCSRAKGTVGKYL